MSTTAELREARRRNALLREQLAERHLKRQVEIQESAGLWVEPYAELVSTLARRDWGYRGPASKRDRSEGRNYPIHQNELELAFLRAPSRLLLATNGYAAGLLEGLSSYVNGVGFTYKATAKDEADAPLAEAAQQILDDFLERNSWFGGEQPGLEDEQFWRSHEDGESYWALTALDDGRTAVRNLEPERITMPPGMDFREWSYGVLTEPHDTERHLAYWFQWGDSPQEGVEYSPDDVIAFRRNCRRGMKRGHPSFAFGGYDALYLAGQLVKNLAETAAEQAAIVFVREHAQATVEQVNDFVSGSADFQQLNALSRVADNVTRYRSGRHEDIPEGMKYVAPPTATNSPIHLNVLQGVLRAAGVRFSAPEWLVSGDASNNNYASSLTAESPFVRSVSRDQRPFKTCRKKACVAALKNWCNHYGGIQVAGVLVPWQEVARRVDVQVEAPSAEVRDRDKEANRLQVEHEAGVTSRQTWQQLVGRDPDTEEANLAEERQQDQAAGIVPNGMQPPGQDGGGDPNQPPGGEDDEHMAFESLLESVAELLEANFDPTKHPRDKDGKFITIADIAQAKTDPAKADELRKRVRPEDRKALERRINPTKGTRAALKKEFEEKLGSELRLTAKQKRDKEWDDMVKFRTETAREWGQSSEKPKEDAAADQGKADREQLEKLLANKTPWSNLNSPHKHEHDEGRQQVKDVERMLKAMPEADARALWSKHMKNYAFPGDANPLADAQGNPKQADGPAKPEPAPAGQLHPKIPVYIRGETFRHKDVIRAHGGRWDAEKSAWIVTQDVAKKLKALSLPGVGYTVPKELVKWYHPERHLESVEDEAVGEVLLEEVLLEKAGQWVTIGGRAGEDGKRKGGSPVYIENGRITKGHPSLTGKKVGALQDAPDEKTTHRQDLHRSKEHSRAKFAKDARADGIDASHLHQLAAEMLAHDAEYKTERTRALKDARKALEEHGGHGKALHLLTARGADADNFPHLDEVAEELASSYPALFPDREREHDSDRLLELLKAGNPERMTEQEAYENALEHLRANKHLMRHKASDDAIPESLLECGGEGGKPGPCPTGNHPDDHPDSPVAHLWAKVKGALVKQYDDLAGFYGRPAAIAIVGVAALPLPGTAVAPFAAKLLAHAVRHFRDLSEALEAHPPADLGPLVQAVQDAWQAACEATGEPVPRIDPEAIRKALAGTPGGSRALESLLLETDGPHTFSSTQINLPPDVAERCRLLAETIPDKDLAEDGRETTFHVTVKYGLHTDSPGEVEAVARDFGPVVIRLGETSIFEAGEHDVVKVDVDSASLHRLNGVISDALPHTDKYGTYRPHVTLAYVKAGRGQEYVGRMDLVGQVVEAAEMVFSNRAGDKTTVRFAGPALESAEPAVLPSPVINVTVNVPPQEPPTVTVTNNIPEQPAPAVNVTVNPPPAGDFELERNDDGTTSIRRVPKGE